MAERAYALYSSWGYTAPIPDSGDAAHRHLRRRLRAPGCLPYRLDRHRHAGPAQPLGRGHHSRRARRRRRDPSQRRDGPQLPRRSRTRSSISSRMRSLPPDTDQWLHEGLRRMGSGSRRERDRRARAESRTERWIASVPSAATPSSIATATPVGCSSSISPSVSATATVKSVLDTSAATPALTGTQALSAVVQPLGTTLGKFFEDYTTARMTGNFTSDLLAGVLPQTQALDRRGLARAARSPR